MRYLIPLFCLLAACSSPDKKNPLVGKWEYERMEMYDGSAINLADSMINNLHNQQKGLTFTFTDKNMFKATQRKPDNTEEFMAQQNYELPEDRKIVRLKNTGRPDDEFPLIEVSDSLLKINIFYSDKAYMVFSRVK